MVNILSTFIQAKLHNERKSDSLLLALEPESAALHLRDEFQKDQLPKPLRNATKYVTIDCGGGTIDIATHQVDVEEGHEQKGKVVVYELHRPVGSDLGSNRINNKFLSFLCNNAVPRLAKFMTHIKERFPKLWLDLKMKFEAKKIRWNGRDTFFVALPDRMFEQYDEIYNEEDGLSKLLAFQKSYKNQDVYIQEDTSYLVIANSIVKSWFMESVNSIVSEVKRINSRYRLEGIFVVGGFSQCTLLKDALRDEFEQDKIAFPGNSSLAIVQGAAKYGPNPRALKSRKSPATYGIGTATKFKDGVHNEKYKFVTESTGEYYCNHIFAKYVTIDDSLSTDNPFVKVFIPLEISNTSFSVPVYASTDTDPFYTTEESCVLLDTLIVSLPETTSHIEDREIYITFDFSGPEFLVHATENSHKFAGETSFEYLSADNYH